MFSVSELYVGTSGYSYDHWAKGVFYPPRLPRGKWLEYYSEHFNTVELNVTFYRLPQEKTFGGWHQRTPDQFRFAVKGSRYITHVKKLANLGDAVQTLSSRLKLLKEKCSVILWQLPPTLKADEGRLDAFCRELSKTINRRHVFEFRNLSWLTDPIYDILKRHNCALCLADWFDKENPSAITADFVYLRRHGPRGRYEGNYTKRQLKKDAKEIKGWLSQGSDVYVYFNNDIHGYAVANARTLLEALSQI
jgi:uncharacterized protein YecE (DUF72 family)